MLNAKTWLGRYVPLLRERQRRDAAEMDRIDESVNAVYSDGEEEMRASLISVESMASQEGEVRIAADSDSEWATAPPTDNFLNRSVSTGSCTLSTVSYQNIAEYNHTLINSPLKAARLSGGEDERDDDALVGPALQWVEDEPPAHRHSGRKKSTYGSTRRSSELNNGGKEDLFDDDDDDGYDVDDGDDSSSALLKGNQYHYIKKDANARKQDGFADLSGKCFCCCGGDPRAETVEDTSTICGCCEISHERKQKIFNGLRTFFKRSTYYIPILHWLPRYSFKENLLNDMIGALTISVVLIPQAIAYSALANVPPMNGMYTALYPLVFYAIFGSTRNLSIGPEGVIALLVGAAVVPVGFDADSASDLFSVTQPRAILLALLVGVMTLLLGLLRVGFLDNLISRPIMHGFVSASAMIIIVGQMDTFLGFKVEAQELEKLFAVLENLDETVWQSLVIGLSSVAVMLFIDFVLKPLLAPRFPPIKFVPAPFIVVVLTTSVVGLFRLDKYGVIIEGEIQGGLSVPQIPPFWHFQSLRDLILPAALITLVGFVESNSIAKTYSAIDAYEVSSNRELVAFGVSNSLSSCFGCFPAFGSLTRSAIAHLAAVKTQLTFFFTATIILVTILFLMPLLYYLPKCAVAAIVIVAATHLIEFDIKFLLTIKAYKELFLSFFTCGVTLLLGAELGIIIAVAASIYLVVHHTTLPSVIVLGKDDSEKGKWRDLALFPEAQLPEGMMVIRIDESLYFGNIETLGSLHVHPSEPSVHQVRIFSIIIDCPNVHSCDAVAINVLCEMLLECHRRGVMVIIVHLKEQFVQQMALTQVFKVLQHNALSDSIDESVTYAQEMHRIRSGSARFTAD